VLFANAASAAPAGGRFGGAAVAVGTRDVAHFMLSLFEAYALASTWKVWLNVAVGRQRPDWYARLATGDESLINEGRLSYPSGHAAYTHASAAVCTLYIAARLRVFAPGEQQRAQMARLLAAAAPLAALTSLLASGMTVPDGAGAGRLCAAAAAHPQVRTAAGGAALGWSRALDRHPALKGFLQLAHGGGLGEVVVHAGGEAFLAVAFQRVGRERDDVRMLALGFPGANGARRGVAVDPGHLAVHEHHVVGLGDGRIDGLLAVFGDVGL
jgi:hypothetical protein